MTVKKGEYVEARWCRQHHVAGEENARANQAIAGQTR